MADRSQHQQGIIRRFYEHFDDIAIQRLSELVSEIYLAEANKPAKLWEKARSLLSRIAADDPHVAKIIATKDIKGLARLVNELSAGSKERKSIAKRADAGSVAPGIARGAEGPAPDIAAGSSSPQTSADPLSAENLKRAMKAFRKRLKLTRLDDESRLGRAASAMSGGRKSQIAAIMAPREFPKAVWDELVRQGKLRSSDGVFYELAE